MYTKNIMTDIKLKQCLCDIKYVLSEVIRFKTYVKTNKTQDGRRQFNISRCMVVCDVAGQKIQSCI